MVGLLAGSKAGHDSKKVYLIIREDENFVYLCDGINKTLENPKKKSKKHIQIIKKGYKEELTKRLIVGEKVLNEEIKRLIKEFVNNQEVKNV